MEMSTVNLLIASALRDVANRLNDELVDEDQHTTREALQRVRSAVESAAATLEFQAEESYHAADT